MVWVEGDCNKVLGATHPMISSWQALCSPIVIGNSFHLNSTPSMAIGMWDLRSWAYSALDWPPVIEPYFLSMVDGL